MWKWQYRSLAGGRALIAVVPGVWTEVHWSRRATLAGGAETIDWDPYLKGRSCIGASQGKCPEIISYLDWRCRNTGISWVTGMPSKIKSPVQVPACRLHLSTRFQGTIVLSWLGAFISHPHVYLYINLFQSWYAFPPKMLKIFMEFYGVSQHVPMFWVKPLLAQRILIPVEQAVP